MKFKSIATLIPMLAGLSNAVAAAPLMVCESKSSFGDPLKLTVGRNSARLEIFRDDGSHEIDETYRNIAKVWDGHMTGLITAPGLSVQYQNHYGCFRLVRATMNLRAGIGSIGTIDFDSCRGGTTPDSLCIPDRR